MTYWVLGLHLGSLGCVDKLRFVFLRMWACVAGRIPLVSHFFNWAILTTVRQNEIFWKHAETGCPFGGSIHSANNVSSRRDDVRLRHPAPICLVLMPPLVLVLCIVVAILWHLVLGEVAGVLWHIWQNNFMRWLPLS